VVKFIREASIDEVMAAIGKASAEPGPLPQTAVCDDCGAHSNGWWQCAPCFEVAHREKIRKRLGAK
jgi:hypothetical protein